jgi:hypothetical protein
MHTALYGKSLAAEQGFSENRGYSILSPGGCLGVKLSAIFSPALSAMLAASLKRDR